MVLTKAERDCTCAAFCLPKSLSSSTSGLQHSGYPVDESTAGRSCCGLGQCQWFCSSCTCVTCALSVLSRVTYPNLVRWFEEVGVETEVSDMSFAVSLDGGKGCEWASTGLAGLFAQKRNLANPHFYLMLREMLLFHTDVLAYLARLEAADPALDPNETLGAFLAARRYSAKFRECYLVPVCAAIWSCGADGVLGCSASAILSFLRNHHMLQASEPTVLSLTGLTLTIIACFLTLACHKNSSRQCCLLTGMPAFPQIFGRPPWLTVTNRSQTYVAKIVAKLLSAGSDIRLSTAVTSVERTSAGTKGCKGLCPGWCDSL